MQTAVLSNLIKEQLAAGKTVRLHVSSNSMSPLIRAGHKIEIVRHEIISLKIGQIITVIYQGELLTHRLVKINLEDKLLTTCGQWQRHHKEQVPFSNLIGKVETVYKPTSQLNLTEWRGTAVNRILFFASRLWRYIPSLRPKPIAPTNRD